MWRLITYADGLECRHFSHELIRKERKNEAGMQAFLQILFGFLLNNFYKLVNQKFKLSSNTFYTYNSRMD